MKFYNLFFYLLIGAMILGICTIVFIFVGMIYHISNNECLEELNVIDIVQIACEDYSCEYLIDTSKGKKIVTEKPIVGQKVCTTWRYGR